MKELKNIDYNLHLSKLLHWTLDAITLIVAQLKTLTIENDFIDGKIWEFKKMREFNSFNELSQVVVRIGNNDPHTLNSISTFKDISKENSSCCRKRLSVVLKLLNSMRADTMIYKFLFVGGIGPILHKK